MSNGSSSSAAATAAQQFLTAHGWGASGKMLGISKMFQDADLSVIKSGKMIASLRPRGVLSGFLVIAPGRGGEAVFVPPVGAKMAPRMIRMRISEALARDGAIFSAYMHNGTIVVEDVLMFGSSTGLFHKMGFMDRWKTFVPRFCKEWTPDAAIQGVRIRLAEPMCWDSLNTRCVEEGALEGSVIEFIPLGPAARRLIWIPSATDEGPGAAATGPKQIMIARRESAMGPDVYSLRTLEGDKQGAVALVRTLAVSRALKAAVGDEFRVQVAWNKMFERQEILGVV
jgi:hypothetical protein